MLYLYRNSWSSVARVTVLVLLFMVLAGLVWYPVKIMLRKRREKKEAVASAATQSTTTQATTSQASDTPSAE